MGDDEISNFIDCFDKCSYEYIFFTIFVYMFIWFYLCANHGFHINCGCSTPILFTAVMSVFFDLTAGGANARARNGPSIVYAIGSAFHFAAFPIHALIPDDVKDLGSCRIDYSANTILFIGEFLELLAIILSIREDGPWVLPVCVTVLVCGAFAIVLYIFRPVNLNGDLDPWGKCYYIDHPAPSLNALICGFQITYIGIVVIIAATSDWRRLLWLLPEVPFETILVILRICSLRICSHPDAK